MKSVIPIWKLLAICIIFTIACENKSEPTNNNKPIVKPKFFTDYLGDKVTGDFKGIVIDENKIPIKDVIITIGNKTTTTDSNGNFKIKKANVNVLFTYVKFKKNGYINTSKSMIPKDSINEIIKILRKEIEPSLFRFSKNNYNLPLSDN
ncbi:carboxypeptidase-like regulatory domain-containing protein [Winogradskyella sp. PG-2]|uniref:carboxypeptidase-like regulatory domain-containing protein n=1 Tax=Winogradskyella sp. PG-2 TaxID=754409 RepID=UPI00045878CE|nr:carboxypeptidase-like regulatory domain-containing protein [Winogradskyella sp. PG-2]BAO74973.1 hypothetical protein WPG_0743 [Winogradskyella sp. PG-2]